MNISRKSSISLGAFLMTLSGLTFMSGQAQADLIFNANSVVGNLYNYDLNFSNNMDMGTGLPSQRLQAGDFATIYDIGLFNGATLSPTFASLFTLSTQNVGITPPGVLPTDDPGLTNVTLTYTGPNTMADTSFQDVLQLNSGFDTLNPNGEYASLVTKNAGIGTGTGISSIGSVSIPGPNEGPHVGPTPEPGSLALFLGASLSGSLVAFRRRRSRK